MLLRFYSELLAADFISLRAAFLSLSIRVKMSKTEKLIEIVRNYPILYNMSHTDYKNLNKKDKIWTEIGKELNDNGEKLKHKWKNLRDTYAKYIRAIKTRTGHEAKKRKKWLWAEHMKPFRPFLINAKNSSNISNIDDVNTSTPENNTESQTLEDNIDELEHLQNNFNGKIEEDEEDINCIQSLQCSTPLSEGNSTSSSAPNSPPAKTPKRTIKKCTLVPSSSAEDTIEYFNSRKRVEYDDIDCLLLAHAKTIKKFSAKRQAIAKFKIAQIIMEQEILHLEDLESTNSVPNVPRPESACNYVYK